MQDYQSTQTPSALLDPPEQDTMENALPDDEQDEVPQLEQAEAQAQAEATESDAAASKQSRSEKKARKVCCCAFCAFCACCACRVCVCCVCEAVVCRVVVLASQWERQVKGWSVVVEWLVALVEALARAAWGAAYFVRVG